LFLFGISQRKRQKLLLFLLQISGQRVQQVLLFLRREESKGIKEVEVGKDVSKKNKLKRKKRQRLRLKKKSKKIVICQRLIRLLVVNENIFATLSIQKINIKFSS
jgi:hypothetical protein